jgi:hypothetical protein
MTGMKKSFLNSPLFIGCCLYVLVAVLLLPYYRYQVNPDGISYINIAYKYYNGNFNEAINGYWGPFISWLLVPFLFFIKDPLLAFRVLSILTGLFTWVQAYYLIRKLGFPGYLQALLLLTAGVITLSYSFILVTPDLLFAGFGLMLANGLMCSQQNGTTKNMLFTAFAGASLYFTKSYGFYYAAGCFLLLFITNLYHRKIDRRLLFIQWLRLTLIFTAICSAWIVLISVKYDQFTIGTSGQYNHKIFGPDSPGPPMYHAGLMDPPNTTATSVREDLSFVSLPGWGVFDSKQNLQHQWQLVKINLYSLKNILLQFSWLSIPLLLLLLFFMIRKRKKLFKIDLLPLLIMMAILPLGYLLLILIDRYIWLLNFLLLFAGISVVLFFLKQLKVSPLLTGIIAFIIAASFLVDPIRQLQAYKNADKGIFDLSAALKKSNIHGRIASSGNWEASLSLSFYLRSAYYGECKSRDSAGIIRELNEKKINYYLVWDNTNQPSVLPEQFPEITGDWPVSLHVYKIAE